MKCPRRTSIVRPPLPTWNWFLCFPFVFFWFVLFLLPLSSFLRFFSYSIQMLVEFVLMPLINCTLAPLFVPLLFSLSLALVVYLLCSPVDSHVSNWSRPDFCFRPCTLRGGLTAQPNDDGISAVDDAAFFRSSARWIPSRRAVSDCSSLKCFNYQFSVSTGIIC